MTVTEVKQALGAWELRLKKRTPRSALNKIGYLGHIAIIPGQVDVAQYGDSLLLAARYVGVFKGKSASDDLLLTGQGMAYWLGDSDDKGDVFETPVVLIAASFATSINALLPSGGAVTAGVINSVSGTYTGRHEFQTPRRALDYVADAFSAEWRVTGDGKLDAGLATQLYTGPNAMLHRKSPGRDLKLAALAGQMILDTDVEDYTIRVVLLAAGDGDAVATGSANGPATPYKDIHGNNAKITRLVSESDTSSGNANQRAQLALSQFQAVRAAVQLSTSEFDVKGDFVVGDWIWVYDPDNGFVDNANEVIWEGEAIHPIKLRCSEMQWPVRPGWTVAFRSSDGSWTDLSPYYVGETGVTVVGVGGPPRSLTGISSEDPRPRISVDSSVPAAPTLVTPFSTAVYQANVNDVLASVLVDWTQPLNTDGSIIIDGHHYEVRYRVTQAYSYPITHAQMASFHHNQIQTHARPLSNPAATSNEWNVAVVPWDQTQVLLQELLVAANYDFQVRAVDSATPPNSGAWSATSSLVTKNDVIGPDTPAAPVVATSRLSVQVLHTLGKASGGTYNLPSDLDHLEIHIGGQYEAPSSSTLKGKLLANQGMITGKIPAVGTFQVDNTSNIWVKIIAVDRYGNKSGPSTAVQSSVSLIDNAHISDLSVSKLTAGQLTANMVLGARIATALAGQRVEMNQYGLQAFGADGDITTNLSSDPGFTGHFIAFTDGMGTILASISEMGIGSFVDASVSDDIFLRGRDLQTEIIDPLPRGIMAWTKPSWGTTAGTTELGHAELSVNAESSRIYRIHLQAEHDESMASSISTWAVRDGGSSEPTISSTLLWDSSNIAYTVINTDLDTHHSFLWIPTAGLHRLIWTLKASIGDTEFAAGASWMWIEDIGSTISDTGVQNTGGGSGVPPITQYTKQYAATWTGSYTGYGGRARSTTKCYQGQYDGDWGNQRSLIGFNAAAIQADLVGATIIHCKITLYFEHWYYSAGGTAIIGTHSYTSEPSAWADASVNQDRVQSSEWPKPGKRTVSLGTTIGGEFKTGTSKGIALGPGPNDSLTYYGYATGLGGGSNSPVLEIKYQK